MNTYFNLDVTDIEQNRLVLYPKSVEHMLHIKSNKPLEGIKIYNVLGQLISNGKNQANLNSLDISHFNSGQFVIKAHVNGDSGVYKFMK